jgi:16S rRNA processing protein RimM
MTTDQSQPEAWTWLARIRRAQGRHGEVLAELLTDFPEKFSERRRVWLLTAPGTADESVREAELKAHRLNHAKGAGIVLHLAGIDSIPAADALRDAIVAIPRSERATLDKDGVYIGDLIGCTLIDLTPAEPLSVGLIEGVDRDAGPVALLVLTGPAGEEILVPFAKAYLRRIDLEAQRVEMALPAGLIELGGATS